jgi:hypothetical protein
LYPSKRTARSFPVEPAITLSKKRDCRRFSVIIFAAVQSSAEICVELHIPAGKQQLETVISKGKSGGQK